MSLDFDYAILTRKRDFRPSFLLYFGARWFPLIVIFLEMLGQDVRYMNCQLYVVFAYLLTYLGFLFASSLIVLRIVAIWERDKIAMTIAGCTWLSNFVMCIYCVATVRAVWIAPLRICGISDVLKVRFSIISIISSEVVLLALVIVGLLRWRNRGKGGLWKLLFTQGLAWVVVTLVAEIPPLVFILLNLNVMMDLITHLPALCMVSIAATRMYRGLSDYLGRTTFFHSTQVTPGPGAVHSNSTPFGNFIAPPSPDNISGFESMQGGSRSSFQGIGSLTVASSNDAGEEKAPSVGDESV